MQIFMYTAESIEKAFGYPEGVLPRQKYYCQYREDMCPVFIDIYGKVMDIEDSDLDQMVKQGHSIPEKLHKDFNRTLLSIIQQNLQNVLPFDTDEPLGVLQAYQAAVSAQIAKEAKSRFPEIEEALSQASAQQLWSRQDVNALRDEADI
jgi:hypothetical protein